MSPSRRPIEDQATEESEYTSEGRGRADSPVTSEHRSTLERVAIIAAILAPTLYALFINLGALDNPPGFDSLTTVAPAALTIVDYDFDIWAVANLPSALEGGPSIHATSIYTVGLAILIWLFGASTAFELAHFGSIILVAGLAGAAYLLARERASVFVSALAAATVSVVPLVVQQAADIYIDLPLAVVATLACWSATRRRFWLTAVLVIVGAAMKTPGIFLLPLLVFARPEGKPIRRHVAHAALAGAVAMIPFLAAFATTDRFNQGEQPWADPTLLTSTASALLLTTDVFLLLSVYALVLYGRARAHGMDRVTKAGAIAVGAFFTVYGGTVLLTGTIIILPRYYIAILPAMLVALLPSAESEQSSPGRVAGLVFVIALMVFSLANVRGDLYYFRNHDFYVMAERSTRAQQLLELQRLGTERLVATGLPLVVERQVNFQLEYPEMGYVEATPGSVMPAFEPLTNLPDRFAMLIERRKGNPLTLVEELAEDRGFTLSYETLSYGPFQSQLVIAEK